mmetsp:Transcript_14364/g.41284  ORF Transcript_14364/g.41284 Transcript_14364/m.41284 type:complete len:201 (+) Transcript_14364:199-801(+)
MPPKALTNAERTAASASSRKAFRNAAMQFASSDAPSRAHACRNQCTNLPRIANRPSTAGAIIGQNSSRMVATSSRTLPHGCSKPTFKRGRSPWRRPSGPQDTRTTRKALTATRTTSSSPSLWRTSAKPETTCFPQASDPQADATFPSERTAPRRTKGLTLCRAILHKTAITSSTPSSFIATKATPCLPSASGTSACISGS